MDTEQYRCQKFMSDIAGHDIHAHNGDPEKVIKLVRKWLSNISEKKMSGGSDVIKRYKKFREQLPKLCEDRKIEEKELEFNDYPQFASWWLQDQRMLATVT